MLTCDRCSNSVHWRIMSMFNQDMICRDCKDAEKKHPDYELACRMEEEACRRGDYNFPGIGWRG